MKIEMNGIALDSGEEGGEGRSVKNIATEDARNVKAYDSPGTQGSSYNDQGRTAVKLAFEGTAAGKDARTLLEGIWSCFKRGDPVDFYSDISGAADVTKVLIESFVVTSAAGDRNRYDYAIGLWEYKEPPEEPTAPGAGAEEGAEVEKSDEAEEWTKEQSEIADKSNNVIEGVILDAEGLPAKGIKVKIAGAGEEIEATTDDNGKYNARVLKPGDYTITVSAEGYEDIKEEITIG